MNYKIRLRHCRFTAVKTLQGLLDELDVIELFEGPEHSRVLGEITEKQKELFHALAVTAPCLMLSQD